MNLHESHHKSRSNGMPHKARAPPTPANLVPIRGKLGLNAGPPAGLFLCKHCKKVEGTVSTICQNSSLIIPVIRERRRSPVRVDVVDSITESPGLRHKVYSQDQLSHYPPELHCTFGGCDKMFGDKDLFDNHVVTQ